MAGNDADDTCPRCQKCDRWRSAPEHIREPMLLWDRFPCPPPGTDKDKLIVELDWTGRMGPRNGCAAFSRVAKRCNVEFKHVTLPESLRNCDNSSVFGLCGGQCVIAIILACILVMFIFILVIVCCRYVRRTDKSPVAGVCTKVVSPDEVSLNAQLNRYYIQSQYYYRAGNIPERRGLPFEVRATENGVEARLIKAIQAAPTQGYQFDDTCSQCRSSISRHSTLSSNRSRQGYERVYWRDKEGLERRVPSNDSLMHRRQSDRHRSIAGSSSDMSHYYEYIGDAPCDSNTNTFNGRRSNHSTLFFPRNSSSNFKEVPSSYGDTRCSDDERVLMLSRFINTEMEERNNPQREIVPQKSAMLTCADDKNTCHYNTGSLNGQCFCSDSGIITERGKRPITTRDERQPRSCSTQPFLDDNVSREHIRGYKYTYNPNFEQDPTTATTTTTTSKTDYADLSSSPCTPSDCLDFEDMSCSPRDNCDTSSSPNSTKVKVKARTPSQRSLQTPDSDNCYFTNNLNIPRTNGTFYKVNRSK